MADEATNKEVVIEEPPKVKSGMQRVMDIASKEPVETVVKTDDQASKVKEVKPTYDYTFIKDLSKDDLTKYEPLKEKYGEEVYFQQVTLANDVKKNQRLVSEREKELNTLKSVKPEEELAKHREFIDGLKKDGIATYKRFQKDFDLPDIEFIGKQMIEGGDVQSRMSQWQETELTPQIEQKFKIEQGTFVYDPAEAYKAGSPSYEYRVATEKKEKFLTSEYETQKTREHDIVSKVKQQTDTDMKFLRETYFPTSEFEVKDDKGQVVNAEEAVKKADEAFVGLLQKIDENQEAMRKGDFNPELNPYSLRVIFRGMNFDALTEAKLSKQAKDIHTQYNQKGLYLPNEKNEVTDVTKLKSKSISTSITEEQKKHSPMLRNVSQSLNR